jgi:hypothetical protein
LFNATYPFSFFLQVQVYSVVTALSVAAYVPFAFISQWVPVPFIGGGYNYLAAWLFCLVGCSIALSKLGDIFTYLEYPESRTAGNGFWHPWVAYVVTLIFLSQGSISAAASGGTAAALFEPVPLRPGDAKDTMV